MKIDFEYPNNFITIRVSHPVERFPIAYACLDIKKLDNVKTGVLCGLLRYPEFSGLGICRQLAVERIRLARLLGCAQVYTAVYHMRHGLIMLYEAMGFVRTFPLSPEYVRLVKRL